MRRAQIQPSYPIKTGLRLLHHVGTLLLLACTASTAAAQSPTLHIMRVVAPPKLSDFLQGTPPNAGTKVDGFRQRRPGDGNPVTEPTVAFLSYDARNVYVVFVCKDEPGKSRARMAKREDVFADDLVFVNLDTFKDGLRNYMFAVNPLGIQLDGIATEGQEDDWSFDTLWRSEGALTPDGYAVLLSIPFKSLRFPDTAVQRWGISLSRSIPRNNEQSNWPYITDRIQGVARQMATLEGIEGVSPGRNMQFIPYGAFTESRLRNAITPTGPEFHTDTDARAGVDSKIVLQDAFTLDLTVNPDFSQVESDEPQVTVNQRFEVFFPEKRPFFIENAGFFRTLEDFTSFVGVTTEPLLFSRRIQDPQFGARITGKKAGWLLGGLVMDDRAAGSVLPVPDPHHESRATVGILRIQRELPGRSAIGVLATSRDFLNSSNRVGSIDARMKLAGNWTLIGQAAASRTEALSGAKRNGASSTVELTHVGRHFYYASRYLDRTPAFRADLGFIVKSDVRQTDHYMGYRFRPTSGPILSLTVGMYNLFDWNRDGRLQQRFNNPHLNVEFPRQTNFYYTRIQDLELFAGQAFHKHRNYWGLNSQWWKWVEISSSFQFGTGLNFIPAAGREPFVGNFGSHRLTLTFRPQSAVKFDQTYIYTRLGTRANSADLAVRSGTSVFNNHLVRSKLNVQFTRELSVRAILDYRAVLPNQDLVKLEREHRVAADILLTYLLNPGTALYVGYADSYDRNNETRLGLPSDPGMASKARQLFIKLSYLFRY